MAMTISTLIPSLKPSLNPFKPYNKFTSPPPSNIIITPQSFNSRNCNHAFPLLIPSSKNLGFTFFGSCSRKNNNNNNSKLGFSLKAQNAEAGGVEGGVSKAEKEAFGSSTMPDRFKITPVPSRPVLWPYLLALPFLVCFLRIIAWEVVIWEVGKWRKLAAYIAGPVAPYVAGPIKTALLAIPAFYFGIVAYAPITDLTLIIVLSSIVLAIAEAVVPDVINSQPYVLTVAGIVGFAAFRRFISEPVCYALLLCLVGFSLFIKKRDTVSSTLPAAAVLAATGEPRVRFIVMISYLTLAIIHRSYKPSEEKNSESTSRGSRVPFPLLCAALAIGIHLAVKWAGYRHLTWMIV